jgi:protein involved in polysaccharide export with SLBB domain
MPLRTGDRVYVREIPRWRERHEVKIRGEVKYPGEYAIEPNATRLTEVIARAGGFSEKASLEDAVIIRTKEMNLEDKEYKRLEKLPPSEMSVTELQYFRTKAREVRGVISVNFTDLFNKGALQNNPVLQDGDSIYVPERNNYVNVSGSVRNPGRIVFKPGLTYEQYIDLAGGYGFRADRDATFVVKVKGDQFPADSENYTLEPGDNILVLDEPETLAIDIFTKALTIATQLVTIMGVVLTIVRLQ